MLIPFCQSKIAHGRITDANLHYEGSITVDTDLLQSVGIVPGQQVEILNMNNGQRFSTYTIAGEPGSKELCLNGPAARLGLIGDPIIILAYVLLTPDEVTLLR